MHASPIGPSMPAIAAHDSRIGRSTIAHTERTRSTIVSGVENDLAGKPMNSLLDEVLAPVDREVFRREVKYYDAVHADVTQNGATPPGASQPVNPAQQVEK